MGFASLKPENAATQHELMLREGASAPSGWRPGGWPGDAPGCHRQVVQKLTRMVGRNVKLYDMVLQFLRTLFLRTRNVHYCTLRAELLMSLHDLDVGDICSVDPCHKVGAPLPSGTVVLVPCPTWVPGLQPAALR